MEGEKQKNTSNEHTTHDLGARVVIIIFEDLDKDSIMA
jgi:hypothetical protein